MNLCQKIFRVILTIVRIWCISFCVVSLGYFSNNYILKEKLPIQLSLQYFGYLFVEGIIFCMLAIGAYFVIRYFYNIIMGKL